MNVLIAKALAVVLLVAGLIFGFNIFVDHQRDIGYQKRVAEDAVQLNADLLAAKEQTERMFRIHDKAIAEGAQREQALKTQLFSARAVSNSLRESSTSRSVGGLSAPNKSDGSSANAVSLAGDATAINDCAVTTLQLNHLQQDIEEQPWYSQ